MNRRFFKEFLAADPPCFAMGVVEERQLPLGLLALHTVETIPPDILNCGFGFGHSVLGNTQVEVIHFAFFHIFNVLVNPISASCWSLISAIISD